MAFYDCECILKKITDVESVSGTFLKDGSFDYDLFDNGY